MEIEIRSLIDPQKFEELMHFFSKNAKFLGVSNQETFYFNVPLDVRLQKTDNQGKLWLKEGEATDDARNEITVRFERNDFAKMLEILHNIGLKEKSKWYRVRHKFEWRDVLVYMDFTVGFGHVIEIEKQGKKKDIETVLEELQQYFTELDVHPTPKEIFEEKSKLYENNWDKLIKN